MSLRVSTDAITCWVSRSTTVMAPSLMPGRFKRAFCTKASLPSRVMATWWAARRRLDRLQELRPSRAVADVEDVQVTRLRRRHVQAVPLVVDVDLERHADPVLVEVVGLGHREVLLPGIPGRGPQGAAVHVGDVGDGRARPRDEEDLHRRHARGRGLVGELERAERLVGARPEDADCLAGIAEICRADGARHEIAIDSGVQGKAMGIGHRRLDHGLLGVGAHVADDHRARAHARQVPGAVVLAQDQVLAHLAFGHVDALDAEGIGRHVDDVEFRLPKRCQVSLGHGAVVEDVMGH